LIIVELARPFVVFNQQECCDLITRAVKLSPGLVYGQRTSSVRTNQVFWLALKPALKDRLWNLALDFKQEFGWTWFQEPVQISCYNPGEFYDWHDDVIRRPGQKSRRVLTLTVSLQAAKDAYFETRNHRYYLESGHGIFIPADLEHRATAPSQGSRWALTVWYMGLDS